ncbi:MAG: UpxY family transcription antiterminator [Thermodesulfobacteriota bacterium]|nr:UpxY family transcription antiterminator [Thermodesulfobacteriota bacterium]
MMNELCQAWYVVHTKSRFENVVYEGLTRKSKEVFLPRLTRRSRRRDRKKFIRTPLFPGYLFVKTGDSPSERLAVLKTVGVVRMIGNRDRPVPVDEPVIESLRIIVRANDPIETGPCFTAGEHVRVVCGPFAGVEGTFCRRQGKDRVIVNVPAMGQSAAICVEADDVEPLTLKNSIIS